MRFLIKLFTLCFAFTLTQAHADDSALLQKHLDKYQSLTASFKQEVTKQDGSLLSSATGKLALKKPAQFMLHTIEPDEQVLFTKAGDVYFFDPFVNQVSIYSISQVYNSPFMLLTSKDKKLWSGFEITKQGNSYLVVPKDKSQFEQIKLEFVGDSIKSIAIAMTDGNNNLYSLDNLSYSSTEADFFYPIPSDAQIDDERESN